MAESANIEITKNFSDILKVSVINSVGQLVGYSIMEDKGKAKKGTIHLHGQPAGIYIVRIVTSAGVYERKVIKL
jgi:hypothetical protein